MKQQHHIKQNYKYISNYPLTFYISSYCVMTEAVL